MFSKEKWENLMEKTEFELDTESLKVDECRRKTIKIRTRLKRPHI